MIQGIATYLLKKSKEKLVLDYDDEIFLYGVEVIIATLINILLLLLIGIISGTVDQAMVYFISYAFLRKFVGGYHCDTNFKCISFNVLKYVVFLVLITYTKFSSSVFIAVICFTLFLILLQAPFEHKNRKIEDSAKKIYKIYALIITLVYSVGIICLKQYDCVLTYVLIIIDFMALPCMIERYGKNFKSI